MRPIVRPTIVVRTILRSEWRPGRTAYCVWGDRRPGFAAPGDIVGATGPMSLSFLDGEVKDLSNGVPGDVLVGMRGTGAAEDEGRQPRWNRLDPDLAGAAAYRHEKDCSPAVDKASMTSLIPVLGATEWRRLRFAQRGHRIDPYSATRRYIAGQNRYHQQQNRHGHEDGRVVWAHAIEQAGHRRGG